MPIYVPATDKNGNMLNWSENQRLQEERSLFDQLYPNYHQAEKTRSAEIVNSIADSFAEADAASEQEKLQLDVLQDLQGYRARAAQFADGLQNGEPDAIFNPATGRDFHKKELEGLLERWKGRPELQNYIQNESGRIAQDGLTQVQRLRQEKQAAYREQVYAGELENCRARLSDWQAPVEEQERLFAELTRRTKGFFVGKGLDEKAQAAKLATFGQECLADAFRGEFQRRMEKGDFAGALDHVNWGAGPNGKGCEAEGQDGLAQGTAAVFKPGEFKELRRQAENALSGQRREAAFSALRSLPEEEAQARLNSPEGLAEFELNAEEGAAVQGLLRIRRQEDAAIISKERKIKKEKYLSEALSLAYGKSEAIPLDSGKASSETKAGASSQADSANEAGRAAAYKLLVDADLKPEEKQKYLQALQDNRAGKQDDPASLNGLIKMIKFDPAAAGAASSEAPSEAPNGSPDRSPNDTPNGTPNDTPDDTPDLPNQLIAAQLEGKLSQKTAATLSNYITATQSENGEFYKLALEALNHQIGQIGQTSLPPEQAAQVLTRGLPLLQKELARAEKVAATANNNESLWAAIDAQNPQSAVSRITALFGARVAQAAEILPGPAPEQGGAAPQLPQAPAQGGQQQTQNNAAPEAGNQTQAGNEQPTVTGTHRDENAPRGMRNRNPGNVKILAGTDRWRGQEGIDEDFAIFETHEEGLRAMAVLLTTYHQIQGRRTVREILRPYAPSTENNTPAYIRHVSGELGVNPDAEIDLHDENTFRTLMNSIIQHENGQNPYTTEQIGNAINDAWEHRRNREQQRAGQR